MDLLLWFFSSSYALDTFGKVLGNGIWRQIVSAKKRYRYLLILSCAFIGYFDMSLFFLQSQACIAKIGQSLGGGLDADEIFSKSSKRSHLPLLKRPLNPVIVGGVGRGVALTHASFFIGMFYGHRLRQYSEKAPVKGLFLFLLPTSLPH